MDRFIVSPTGGGGDEAEPMLGRRGGFGGLPHLE